MRVILRKFIVVCGLLVTCQLAAAPQHRVLENGMKVIVEVDRRAPVVVHQVWYKVGSISEHDGITGISHVLEHMMFKGTQNRKAGEFSEIVAQNGGRENAFTSREYTGYYQQIAVDRLDLMMELEADRMRNLQLDEAEFRKEVQVVKEERRTRTEDRPRALLYEQFLGTAFLSSPERLPVIGWPRDLDELTLEDLDHWYKQWYAPNNAALVVVGDVDPERVFSLAEKYYGVLEPFELEPIKTRPEVEQRGVRRIELNVPANLPYLIMGFKTPTLATLDDPADAYALEVLAGVLGGGDSARFTRNLVRGKQIAASIGVGYNVHKPRESLFILDGTPLPETSPTDLEKALLDEIEAIKQNGISEQELKRVKAQVIASDVFDKDSMFNKALTIGSLEILGFGYDAMDKYVQGIQSVNSEQVKNAAVKYLIKERLTVGALNPLAISVQESNPAEKSDGQG